MPLQGVDAPDVPADRMRPLQEGAGAGTEVELEERVVQGHADDRHAPAGRRAQAAGDDRDVALDLGDAVVQAGDVDVSARGTAVDVVGADIEGHERNLAAMLAQERLGRADLRALPVRAVPEPPVAAVLAAGLGADPEHALGVLAAAAELVELQTRDRAALERQQLVGVPP